MQGNLFTAQFSAVAITAVQDLFSLLAGATSRLAICRIEFGQYSDAGDAASELLPVQLIRGATTAGSGGSAPTPINVKAWGAASVTTARANDTTQAANGSPVVIQSSVFNVQAGYLYAPRYGGGPHEADERITVAAGQRFVVSLPSAPADSITCSGFIMWEELGVYGS